ncbi:MAG TPA: YciI family protein, partial [Puia sp.]|nr:YciI family protein [Puia sp.]
SITLNISKMDEYVLIMRHEDGGRIASPEQMQAWMKQTMDWIGSIAAQQKFAGGTGLLFEGARVVNANKSVTDGPFGDIKETIGGFITVKADSVEEAVEFAKGCPVLQGEGNTVEVRRIAKSDGVH